MLSPLWIDTALTLLLIGVLAMFGITIGTAFRRIWKRFSEDRASIFTDW